MREIPFEDEFDAVINVSTSFGYLETENEDRKVLREVHKALKPGGRFLLEVANRDDLMRRYATASVETDSLEDGTVVVWRSSLTCWKVWDCRCGRAPGAWTRASCHSIAAGW
jgi:SAM-dependent methyltransferase